MNIKEATQKWVGEFNSIPMSLIEKAYPALEEIEILSTTKECEYCGNTEYKLNDEDEKVCNNCDVVREFYDSYELPMWGTVWTFDTSLDDDWIKRNLEIVSECGFWVYETDELGVFIGINGAGYDFYESHWIPLYKARGFKWHKEE